MRILQVEKSYWPRGGAPKYALLLSELLRHDGHAVIPFAATDERNLPTPYSTFFAPTIDFQELGKVSFFTKVRAAGQIMYSFAAKHQLERLLAEEKIDIAHLHTIYHQISPSILPVLKKRGIPIVMTLHDYKLLSPNYLMFHHGAVHEEDAHGWYWSCVRNKCFKNNRLYSMLVTAEMIFHHRIKKYYERNVDIFLAPSIFIRELFIKHGWPAEKIVVVPLPTDVVPLPSNEAGEYALYAGRLSEEKGLDVLLAAAALTPDIPYVLVGAGPEEMRLAAHIKDAQLNNVKLLGYKHGSELTHVVNHARLVVAPSVWYENCPLSVLEAKAAGKVVIGSAIGGLPELLPDELLVRSGDPAALAQKIGEWFAAPAEKLRALGSQLRDDVHKKNDPADHLQTIESIYAKLLQKN